MNGLIKFKKIFQGKTKLFDRSLPALIMACNKLNKQFNLPRGASLFRSLAYDQMSLEELETVRNFRETAIQQNHSLDTAIDRYAKPSP